jgi:drug/metabolite transporter (DMT)-like permease
MPPPEPVTASTRVAPGDLVWLAVAVAGISTSGPVIRQSRTPSLTLSVWRNLGGAFILAAVALLHSPTRRSVRAATAHERRQSALAGVLLGLHFVAWVPSLSFTSVASSTALVATQPVWAAVIARLRGHRVPRVAWFGIGLALAGTLLLSGVDLSVSKRKVLGDLLAVLGGALAAAYVTVGASARRTIAVAPFGLYCFATAGVVLIPIAMLSGAPLVSLPLRSWLGIGGLVLGAQLLGHFVFGQVLKTTGPVVVSLAVLFELVGATLLAWLWFQERPGWALVPAAILIAAGVILVVRSGSLGDDASAGNAVVIGSSGTAAVPSDSLTAP